MESEPRDVASRVLRADLSVLAALCDEPSEWRHGYALAGQAGLKSGMLYPDLIRLADRGLVEACWQDEPHPGRAITMDEITSRRSRKDQNDSR